jgi:hypothetical protein
MNGQPPRDSAGVSVSSAGDVNGDGFDDMLVGAWIRNNGSGACYVVFGKAGGFTASLDLSTLKRCKWLPHRCCADG